MLDDELIAKAADLIKRVYYIETVADILHISKETIYDWMRKGEAADKADINNIHRRFSDALKEARGEAKNELLAEVRKGEGAAWQAKAWILERCFPNEYSRFDRSKIELTGKDGGALEVNDISKLPKEDLLALKAILEKTQKSD